MRIAVLNGSPKGKDSVTVHYARYLAKHYQNHEWVEVVIARRITRLEESREEFDQLIEEIKSCDAVLWSFPLYYLLVCGQMKRFIELVFERGAEKAFAGKYAAAISTSVHFFDHTAHNYIAAVSEDLGMSYFGGYSAEMQDLMKAGERTKILKFGERFLNAASSGKPTVKRYSPVVNNSPEYNPAEIKTAAKSGDWKITLVTDEQRTGSNLDRMIDVFVKSVPNPVEVVCIAEMDIKGGCLGCIRCSYDNTCVYHDGYKDVFEQKIKTADALVFAGTIRDRYLSSRWKVFFDRSFYNGHIPVLMGKKLAYIISGPLRQNDNLRHILEAYTQVVKAGMTGIVTDEYDSSDEVTSRLKELAENMMWSLDNDYIDPRNYLGVSGSLLFRDLVYGELRFPFVADHKYYKKQRLFDFPQKQLVRRAKQGLMSALFKLPGPRKSIQKKMVDYMVQPFRDFVEGEKKGP